LFYITAGEDPSKPNPNLTEKKKSQIEAHKQHKERERETKKKKTLQRAREKRSPSAIGVATGAALPFLRLTASPVIGVFFDVPGAVHDSLEFSAPSGVSFSEATPLST
jgi:hypothetical protein